MIPRLKEQYDKKTIENLQKKFSMKNKLMVPKFLKVVLNMGLGADANDKKKVQNCKGGPLHFGTWGTRNVKT